VLIGALKDGRINPRRLRFCEEAKIGALPIVL
jgi:hypothetical protein